MNLRFTLKDRYNKTIGEKHLIPLVVLNETYLKFESPVIYSDVAVMGILDITLNNKDFTNSTLSMNIIELPLIVDNQHYHQFYHQRSQIRINGRNLYRELGLMCTYNYSIYVQQAVVVNST